MGAARKLNYEKAKGNAVIYARFSSHGQQEQSIDGQLRDCHAFAKREGITVVGEYIDRAISAKTDARPDFRRMIADAAKKQFQYVIVWKLDRFARNRFDSAIHKAALKKHGVKVLSAMENIADNPEGALLEGILESMAEHYSASLAENVKRGQRESVLKGSHVGGIAPFGFRSVKDGDKLRLVADEKNAPIIQYVFQQYANGVSKKQIMEELTARGVLNYNGKPLTYSCLQNALKNTKYIGKYTYGGVEVEGACDALIDERTFEMVQNMLHSRSHGKNAKRVRQEYLLHGKAFCGYCGTPLVGDAGTSRHGNVYNYYACGKKKKYHTCQKLNEKKEFLEWYVVEQTVEYVLQPERLKDIAARVVAAYDNDFNEVRIKDLERQVGKIDVEVDKLVDMMIELPKKAALKLAEKIEVLETQKADIELNLVSLRIAAEHRLTEEQLLKYFKSYCRGEELDTDFQRRIIDTFINCVYVYDDKMVIYYNVKGGKQVSYIEVSEEMEGLSPVDGTPENCYNGGVGGSDSEYSTPPYHQPSIDKLV
jgi:DNA invertase Pin-like site-specific DNA recombinase/NADPH-dependent 7-cyano-7-deazaguanine reductase QueF